MNIKSIPNFDRPREKLSTYGVCGLSDAELLAIVLQSGSREESAIALGQKIACMFEEGLQGLSDVTVEELTCIKGIGQAKACQVSAAVELGKRVCRSQKQILGVIKSPKMVADFFCMELKHENKEKFLVIFLNTKNMITAYEVISVGSLSSSIVHPREVFKRAIKRSAASIILVHNHPSGNPEPSKEDHQVTERLLKVAEIVGIKILDHLIVSGEDYYSFKEMDLI